MSDELKALAAEFGLPEDATADQITEAAKEAKEKAGLADDLTAEVEKLRAETKPKPEDESEVKVLKHANEQLVSRVSQLEAAAAEREQLAAVARKDSAVAECLASGQIRPDEHDFYRANLDINEEGTLRILASLPKGRVPVAERGGAPATNDAQQDDGWFHGRGRTTTTQKGS